MTIVVPEQRSLKQSHPLPPLVHGEPLDQPTFHARYEAMPPETRADLVGGKVYIMSSPVSSQHARTHYRIPVWLARYEASVPGLVGEDNVTTVLGAGTEVQPDALLRKLPEAGGLAWEDDKGHIHGPVELVIEVAVSSISNDLQLKKRDYAESGIQEYLVILPAQSAIHWFSLVGGAYEELTSGPDGIFRSRVFPGLWLDAAALFKRDYHRVWDVVDQGLQSAEHLAWLGQPKR